MVGADRERLETEIRSRHAKDDWAGAAEIAVRGYGPEIYGFLHRLHREEADAAEVFSIFSERMWRGLPSFAWASSFRTWAYTIARNASRNYLDQARVRRVHVPLEESVISGVVEQVRSETASFLKTERKTRMARLRETLGDDERMLLSLRLERGMSWLELARVLYDGEEETPSPETLTRESARHRKRYQTLKARLGEMARREGLLQRNR